MARKLSQVTSQISQFLAKRFKKGIAVSHPIPKYNQLHLLPPVLYIAFLQGESLLRTRFFKTLGHRSITDIESQAHLWLQIVEDHRFIQQICEQSGMIKYFKLSENQSNIKSEYGKACYVAYCIVLWDAYSYGNQNVVTKMTAGLVVHYMPTLYPKQANVTDIKLLKKEIARLLALQWHVRPEIKESFITTEEVVFSLICKIDRHVPLELSTITGKRLKPTRIKCYKKVISQLENGVLRPPFPRELTIKKKDSIVPLCKKPSIKLKNQRVSCHSKASQNTDN